MKTLLALLSSVAVAATAGSIIVGVQIGIFQKQEEQFDISTIPVGITLNDFNTGSGSSKTIKIKSLVFKEIINNPLAIPTIEKLGGNEKFKEAFNQDLGLYDEKGTLKTKPEFSVKENSIYFLRVNDNIEDSVFKGELKITIKKGTVSLKRHFELMDKQEKQNLSNLILGRDVLDERVSSTEEIIVRTILSDLNIDANLNIPEKVEGEFEQTIDGTRPGQELQDTKRLKSDSVVNLYNSYDKGDALYKMDTLIKFSESLISESGNLGITADAKNTFEVEIIELKEWLKKDNSMENINSYFEKMKIAFETFLNATENTGPPIEETFETEEGGVSVSKRLEIFSIIAKSTIQNKDGKKEEKEFNNLITSIDQSIEIAISPNANDESSLIQQTKLIKNIWNYLDSDIPVTITGGFDFRISFDVTPIDIVDLLEIMKQNLFDNIEKGRLVQGQTVSKMSNNVYGNAKKLDNDQLKTEKQNLEYWLNLENESENPYFHLINEFLNENGRFNTSIFKGRNLDNEPTEPSQVMAGQEYTTLTGLYINLSGYQNGEESEFVSMQNQDATIASIYFSNSSINKDSVIVYYG